MIRLLFVFLLTPTVVQEPLLAGGAVWWLVLRCARTGVEVAPGLRAGSALSPGNLGFILFCPNSSPLADLTGGACLVGAVLCVVFTNRTQNGDSKNFKESVWKRSSRNHISKQDYLFYACLSLQSFATGPHIYPALCWLHQPAQEEGVPFII